MKIENAEVNLTLVTVAEINDNSVPFRTLYDHLIEWAAMGDLKEITFIQDGVDPLLYAWRVERNDLSVLDSVFLFDSAQDLDPEVTIALPSPWPLSVIASGAKTRAGLIGIRSDFGLTSFSVVFL